MTSRHELKGVDRRTFLFDDVTPRTERSGTKDLSV